MKKNRMMRTASALLVFTMLTTSIISGTFAKYTTANTMTDTARIAKFGVTVSQPSTAFLKAYEADDSTLQADYSVSAAENVIAPGTSNTITNITASGTPEVAVEVSYSTTVDLGDNWVDASGAYYCPLILKVNDTEFYGMDYASADAFEAAVKAAVENASAQYAAGTNLATAMSSDALKVSWGWAYGAGQSTVNGTTFTGTSASNSDEKDTALSAAENAPEISIDLKVTISQID
jgi:hypothetical protein